jgi:3-hydroxyisobutyrate dehydrogenase-like beta-hydroxyacid dehydrogenase
MRVSARQSEGESDMRLAFLGLGRMGQAMAACLVKAGYHLVVHNRNMDKTVPLEALGAKAAASPAEAVAGADIVFTMLADDAALAAVMDRATMDCMKDGTIHVAMGTHSVAFAGNMAREQVKQGGIYLACPVFGRPDAAVAGNLKLCLAGDAGGKTVARPALACLGEVWDFGDAPAGANAVKLGVNFLLASMIELLGEAFSFTEKNGISPEQFYSFISTTMLSAPVVKTYGRLILDAGFDEPGFTVSLGAKDIRLVREAARASRVPMPAAALLEERFLRLLARGWDGKDWSVVAHSQREDAGLTGARL